MIVAGTGHRPNKIGGFTTENFFNLVEVAERWLSENNPDKVISGMALGWDMALAQACINSKIPFVAAIPFKGQESKWSFSQKELYKSILKFAEEIVYVSKEGFSAQKMQKRNEWMVDRADVILAMWDGTMGGTYNCIRYAESKNKKIINLYEVYRNKQQI